MIYLQIDGTKMLILEPGNLERLRAGRLAVSSDKSVVLAFAPDHLWLQDEILKIGANNLRPQDLERLLKEGLNRADVVSRPYHRTWDAANTKEGKA